MSKYDFDPDKIEQIRAAMTPEEKRARFDRARQDIQAVELAEKAGVTVREIVTPKGMPPHRRFPERGEIKEGT